MDGSSKSERMCCYRCSRCNLEVYRHYIHYDRRDRPICDPDCDGTKPGTCIWCEQVIVGRPMLMFEKKVHRECWQYCVAKFGYDEIVRRYASEDWEKFREREVGEDMVREMVEEFFDKFCTELASDDDDSPAAEDATDKWGRKGEEDWGRAIRRVMRNKKHASLPNIACTKAGVEDENQWRGLSEGESFGAGSARSANASEGEEYREEASLKGIFAGSCNDKAEPTQGWHGAEERTEWLQAVQKSVCGDSFFDRESWADEAYRNTLGHNQERRDVTEDDGRRRHGNDNAISIANTFEDEQSFVDNIIEQAVSVVKECSDDNIYKTIDGKQFVNYDKVWERSTRKKNGKLMAGANSVTQDTREDVDRHSEFNYVRNVLSTCKTSLVDKLIDEAAANYLDTSDEEGMCDIQGTVRRCKDTRGSDVRSVFSKTWDEARAFRAMYEQTTSSTQSSSSLRQSTGNTSREDTGGRKSTDTIKCVDQCEFNGTNSSETTLNVETSGGEKKSNKRRKRRNKQNVLDDGESSARQQSGHDLNSNTEDLIYESASQAKTIETSKSDLAVDNEIFDVADSARSAANIAESGVENILTEEQLDELFGNAVVASGDPGRMGRLINEFKAAVGEIQHNANTCTECPKSGVSSASGNEHQSTCSATEKFATVLAQLMDEVKELRNSILIFRKFARPDHFLEPSVNGELLSSQQGEVYGTGNVLIIFDYGEEPLESDPASVYEYLANIYHDRESPRCFLHRTSSDRFDFSNISEGNISMYNGTDVTDSASTYRDVTSDVGDDATSLAVSSEMGFENMSNYDETLWAETQRDRSESLGSLQVSSRLSGDLFCTDVEAQAWEAMLNAGKSEEISSTRSFEESTKNREGWGSSEEQADDHSEKNVVSSVVSGSRSKGSKRSCDEVAHGGKSTTKQKTDAQLLDRLRSIKRINFDESLTSLRTTTTATGEERRDAAIVVRKSVSESDVALYELCACSTHPSETSVGSGCGAAGPECPTWKEVRRIVTESASTQPLQHSASVGANKEPTDVYQIAIEITINKRNDQKGRTKLACRSSSVDISSFFPQSTSSTDNISDSVSESEPNFKHKTQATVADEDGDNAEIQSEIFIGQEVECIVSNKLCCRPSESYRCEVVPGTTLSYLVDDTLRRGLSPNKSSCKRTLSPPLNEINTDSTGTECKIEEHIDSYASGKLNNTVGMVSNSNLITKDLKDEVCKISNKHGIPSSKSSMVDLSCRSSNMCLDLDGQMDETEHHKSSSEFSIDVDLFSSENVSSLRDRQLDYQVVDGTSSNEDLFCIDMTGGKRNFEESKKRTDTIEEPASELAEEMQVSFLKERKANIVQGTSERKVPSGQELEDTFDVVDGSNGSGVVDSKNSIQICSHSYEHDNGQRASEPKDIPRQRSNKEIRIGSLVGGGEIAFEKTGACKVEREHPNACGKNIGGGNSCTETVGRGNSRDEVNSKMSTGGQTSEMVEGNVGKDDSKSCNARSEEAEGSFITLTEEDIFLRLVKEPKIAKPISLENERDMDTSKRKDVDFKTLVEEDIFLKTLPRSVQTSFVSNIDQDSSKHTGDVYDSSVKPSLVPGTAEETKTGLETVIASFDYVEPPLLAEVASKRSNLNILQKAREHCANQARFLEHEFENEELVEKEIGCMRLCEDDYDFDEHPSNQDDSILGASFRSSTQVAFNSASPNKLENHHGGYLSHREIDNEFTSRRNVLHNTSSATTASDLGSYKGNSTEEEQEVCTLLSTSEYDIDHRWPSQCGSDPNVPSGDTDGVSVLTMIRDSTTSKRNVGVCGEDYSEEFRGERIQNEPLAGGENVIKASSSNITRTSLVIDESERESSKDIVREGNAIKKKAGIKNRKEKKIQINENLDEICRLDEDENGAKHVEKGVGVSESITAEVVPAGGKKSKRKKDKKDGHRKGSPTCVIL